MSVTMKAALVGAGLLLGTAASAPASPFAGQYRFAEVTELKVTGHDGAQWRLSVRSTAVTAVQSRAEQRLYVDLTRCVDGRCTPQARWSQALTSDEVAINDGFSEGTLRTAVAGTPISLQLAATNPSPPQNPLADGGAFTGLGLSTDPPGASPDVYRFHHAFGKLRIGGLSCRASAARLGETSSVDTIGDDSRFSTTPPAVLPKGFLGSRARC